jgi:hypothetical protein
MDFSVDFPASFELCGSSPGAANRATTSSPISGQNALVGSGAAEKCVSELADPRKRFDPLVLRQGSHVQAPIGRPTRVQQRVLRFSIDRTPACHETALQRKDRLLF